MANKQKKILTSKLNSRTETVYVTNKILELLEYLNFFIIKDTVELNNE